MADSLCGPSNALQNFQKHSTVDRTLQQDRLIGRQSPAQGFRSSPGPNAGFLNPEFEAFQAGQLPLDQGFQPHGFAHAPPKLQQQSDSSAWSSDFQRLQISSPVQQFNQQQFGPQVHQRQDDGGWQQEFSRQQGQMSERSMGKMPSQTNSAFRPMGGMGMSQQYMRGFAGPQVEIAMAQQQQPVEVFDEAAFARAFDEAANAEVETQQGTSKEEEYQQGLELGQDTLVRESVERMMEDSTGLLDQERIGSDRIHDPRSQSPEAWAQQGDPDALAKTAAELLDKVERNQSSKFQNSQFLQLMRQLRSKEATIRDDEFVVDVEGMRRESQNVSS
ncbi:uncharacterized protein L3040_003166 [Drepanopeziza brunnea f. sp. 'multigermtubi']|uniref:Peroxin 20 n=1 Tax=Marssonina brunnea f. sp. multigermtubi (strain MB_m1) TaxID=1072389 RepID=K1WIQ1_MARBU|nr:peroxin 20 [Drepanopeziza brunnea f. sp. 'multigermtubi' MB_m1]EKD12057.1 peroxin 20 [Drepanopeziza brunnea f. sp. 'multigermtubi' MB_m1]KAJ5047339.1 hypothetical protein L3040_003166 [Drepanopeziza brunnea f. sp. 'multigermtubi']